MTDIEIARSVEPKRIAEIAEKAGLDPEKIEPYGRYKAKIDPKLVSGEPGKLILVTAINPTPAGEGLMAVTRMTLASFFSASFFTRRWSTLALYFP